MVFFHSRWPVFYEDNHLLVLYKPAGLLIQRDRRHQTSLADLAKQWLKKRYDKPGRVFAGIVHRLDAPVAGVIVIARTSKAAARLSEQFRLSRVVKTYLAMVQAQPPVRAGRLVHHLLRNGRYSRPVAKDTHGSQAAALSYTLLDTRNSSGRAFSLLSIDLETGRRHQIRAQLAAAGCPIFGDCAYGASQSLPFGRIALMARRLAFAHPTLDTTIDIQCPLPEGWPWDITSSEPHSPLWGIEDYQSQGLDLPD